MHANPNPSSEEVAERIAKDARPIDNNGTIPAGQQPVIESVVITD